MRYNKQGNIKFTTDKIDEVGFEIGSPNFEIKGFRTDFESVWVSVEFVERLKPHQREFKFTLEEVFTATQKKSMADKVKAALLSIPELKNATEL